MKTDAFKAVLTRDMLDKPAAPKHSITAWFACGTTFLTGKRDGQFCSGRCRAWFDNGNPSHADQQERGTRPWRLVAGAARPYLPPFPGRVVVCAGCQRPFKSNGARCCSAPCERRSREREDNLKVMAEVGLTPAAKRHCEICGAVIPKWRKGRATPATKRFCSPKCSRQSRNTGSKGGGIGPLPEMHAKEAQT